MISFKDFMRKIKIPKSPSADTRSAKELVSKETLLASSYQHIKDVQQAMDWMQGKLMQISNIHDHTKLSAIDQFHADFEECQKIPTVDFRSLSWFKHHVSSERHHVKDRCPDDVNLFDLLERVADITTAGMARTGSIYDDTLPPEILQKAYQNTIKLLKENIEVVE